MPIGLKGYLRSAVEYLPHAAAESFHTFGWRGLYLANAAFLLRRQPVPISLPRFGRIDSWAEAVNLIDNFALGELRSDVVEAHLTSASHPCVVDVGVNVGVTSRWWLSLNPALRVIGVDMFQEALDFTTRRIGRNGDSARWQAICGAVGSREETVDVRYDDPLEGTSSVDNMVGRQSRAIRVSRLDDLLEGVALKKIDLLKIDIEGAAGGALSGAPLTLAKCEYVVVETHSDAETRSASSYLSDSRFRLFRSRGRTMWWVRS
ncbi:MAG TPA: FkbM family methyltransferase [Gemmatimonadaceae bacterium]|nr:FkbM family methyltransferase [Gemmatimonadaceae bacterium]